MSFDSSIIYPNESGGIALVRPAPDCGLTLEQIALKDVPPNKPYLIVPDNMIPDMFVFFDAFEADFTSPHGHGADYGTGSSIDVVGWTEEGTPVLGGQP